MGILEYPLSLFVYLSESVGFNLAFPLFFVAPLILFIATPSSPQKLRIATTIAAVFCAYVFINLAIQTRYTMRWNTYEMCQSQFSDGSIQHHDECENIHVANGIPLFFYLLIGWIPGGAYVGIWELIWRRVHRKYLREHGEIGRAHV